MQNTLILLTVSLLTLPFKCQIFHIYRKLTVIWLSSIREPPAQEKSSRVLFESHLCEERQEPSTQALPVPWGAEALWFPVLDSRMWRDTPSNFFISDQREAMGMLQQILCCWRRAGETLSKGPELSGVHKSICLNRNRASVTNSVSNYLTIVLTLLLCS